MNQKIVSWWRLGAIVSGIALLMGLLAASGPKPVVDAQAKRAAQADYFLKIDGIDGESTDNTHKGEIELLSYSWGKDQPGLEQILSGGASGGGVGKVTLHDIHFSANTSKASPQLMVATANGKHFKEATISVRKGGKDPQDYYKIKMSDILISSYQTSGQADVVPTDQFSLNFAKIEVEYKPQKPDGSFDASVKGNFDFKANREF